MVGNKRTRALTKEEYNEIITLIENGFPGARKNPRAAFVLKTMAHTGLRVGDTLSLTLNSFNLRPSDGKPIIHISEEKTGKIRETPVKETFYIALIKYAEYMGVSDKDAPIFSEKGKKLTERAVQIALKKAVEHLCLEGDIGTHSFRKLFATSIYMQNQDIMLVSSILNHSDPAVTRRYIGFSEKDVEKALEDLDY